MFGTVEVERTGYGEEGLQSLHPLDSQLNIPRELYSPELRRRVAQDAAHCSFDDTVAQIRKNTGGDVPKRQSEELAQRAAKDFDAFYDQRSWNPESLEKTGDILVLTVDGKGVVMRTQDLREGTRKAAEASTHKMGRCLAPGKKKNAKRMATVASVYTIAEFIRRPEDLAFRKATSDKNSKKDEPQRPKPECKRVWASLKDPPRQVIEDAFQEAFARDPEQKKKWVALVDGNKDQIKLLRKIAGEKGVELTIVLDIYHVLEYLWKAGRVFHPDSGARLEVWVEDRLLKILRGEAGSVAAGMLRSATIPDLSQDTRKNVDACARYLKNNRDLVQYDQVPRSRFPHCHGRHRGCLPPPGQKAHGKQRGAMESGRCGGGAETACLAVQQ